MDAVKIDLRLPLPGWPRATFVGDPARAGGKLVVGDRVLVEARTREELDGGVCVTLEPRDEVLVMRGTRRGISVRVDGRPAVPDASTSTLARHARGCWRALRRVLSAP